MLLQETFFTLWFQLGHWPPVAVRCFLMELGEVKSTCVLFFKMTDRESQGHLHQSWAAHSLICSAICSAKLITASYDAILPHTLTETSQ